MCIIDIASQDDAYTVPEAQIVLIWIENLLRSNSNVEPSLAPQQWFLTFSLPRLP